MFSVQCVGADVYLSGYKEDYAKITGSVFMGLGDNVELWSRKDPLNFGVDTSE